MYRRAYEVRRTVDREAKLAIPVEHIMMTALMLVMSDN